MKEKPSYYSIIPANVRYDKDLTPNEKLMYGEITALSSKNGRAWAENSYFAELYDVHKNTVSRWISNLEDKGYIRVELEYKYSSKQVHKRYIYMNDTPINNIVNTPKQKDVYPINNNVEEVLSTTRTNITRGNSPNLAKAKIDDTHLTLAKLLWRYVKDNFPKTKEPNLENWADDIRLAMEQDDRSYEDLKSMIIFSQTDDFWYANVRSGKKLRDQFDTLYAQADRKGLVRDEEKEGVYDF